MKQSVIILFITGISIIFSPFVSFAASVPTEKMHDTVTQVSLKNLPELTKRPYTGTRLIVSTKGDNSTAERGNAAKPFKTIQAAIDAAQSGDVITIQQGTYRTDRLNIDKSNIVIKRSRGKKGGKVRIRPKNPASSEWDHAIALELDGPIHDVVIDGLRIKGFDRAGIVFGDPDTQRNIEIRDVTINGADEGVVNNYPTHTEYLIDGFRLHNVTIKDASLMGVTCGDESYPCAKNVFLSKVKINGTNVAGQNSGADGIAFVQSDNVLVHRTLVRKFSSDGMDFKATRVAVVNSTIRNVGRNGLKFWQGGEAINTIVDNTGADAAVVMDAGEYRLINCSVTRHLHRDGGSAYAMTVGYDVPGQDISLEIMNTIFHNHPGPVYVRDSADLTIRNSIFSNLDNGFLEYDKRYTSSSELNKHEFASGVLTSNPHFKSLRKHNYRVKANSPAVDAGMSSSNTPRFDRIGHVRPQSDEIDIGPYEQ